MYDYILKRVNRSSYRLYLPRWKHAFMLRELQKLNLEYIKDVGCYLYYDYDIRIQVADLIDEDDRQELEVIIETLAQHKKGSIVPFLTKLTRFLPQDIGHIYRASWHALQEKDDGVIKEPKSDSGNRFDQVDLTERKE